ncbi:MAG: 3-phosphoshikimate 1-carboxyvinyltransferase [Candidatus Margulisiibacteriota bacterium]
MNVRVLPSVLKTEATIATIPGDKSMSHRAILLGSLAQGTSTFTNFLMSEDCLHTMAIFRHLGVMIEHTPGVGSLAKVKIHGKGIGGLKAYSGVLDAGNSGTGIRLITGVLAGLPFTSRIAGDASIAKRPMMRVIDPLSQMGATITGVSSDAKLGELFPPLTIAGTQKSGPLKPIFYRLPVASAQVKSAVLFAALFCQEPTTIEEPKPTRDHTEKMMRLFGADITVTPGATGKQITCSGKNPLHAPLQPWRIPSDISSAAFLMVLAMIRPDTVAWQLNHVGLNPTRSAILGVLEAMCGELETKAVANAAGTEPADTVIARGSELFNIVVPEHLMPNLIDEIPILAVAAMFAKDTLVVRGAKELRVKESDRIATIVAMVRAFGGEITEFEDGFELKGETEFKSGAVIESFGDHRIAMSAIVAALGAGVEVTVRDCDCIATSFPNFFEVIAAVGARVEQLP